MVAQIKALKRMAAVKHLSMAELIRQGVNTVLRSNLKIDEDEKIRRAKAITRRFRSGKQDISKKHDRYLAETF